MGTRSTITVHCLDGKYRSVYCHWDGYLKHNGRMLLEHYNTQEKAEALVALGDMSSLDISIEKPSGHTFDNPTNGYTVFYGRDRGETGVECSVSDTLYGRRSKEEYNYVWENGKWSWDRGELLHEECGLPAPVRARKQPVYGLYEVITNSLNGTRTSVTKTLLDADSDHVKLYQRAVAYFEKPENARPGNFKYELGTELNAPSNSWTTALPYRSGGCIMTNTGHVVIEELPMLKL